MTSLPPIYLITSWWTFGLFLHFGSRSPASCLCVDLHFYFMEASRRMAASHGELMFSFLGKCQLLPKVVILFNILGTVQLPTSSLTACCLPSPWSGRFLSLCLF